MSPAAYVDRLTASAEDIQEKIDTQLAQIATLLLNTGIYSSHWLHVACSRIIDIDAACAKIITEATDAQDYSVTYVSRDASSITIIIPRLDPSSPVRQFRGGRSITLSSLRADGQSTLSFLMSFSGAIDQQQRVDIATQNELASPANRQIPRPRRARGT